MEVIKDNYLPYLIDLEKQILGSLILYKSSIIEVLPVLKPEVFYVSVHHVICKAILNLVKTDSPIDIITLTVELKRLNELENIGGTYYLVQLTNNIVTTGQISYHFKILLEFYFRRKIIQIGQHASNIAIDTSKDIFEIYEEITKSFQEIDIHISSGTIITPSNVFKNTIDNIYKIEENKRYFPINDIGIDKNLAISTGNLVNISGKSGGGKTSFVTYLAKRLLELYPNEISICWYTMEDDPEKIMLNFISPYLLLTYKQINRINYNLSPQEKLNIEKHANQFKKFDIEFVHTSSYVSHIKTHFKKFCQSRPNKFNILIIDNIMLLKDNHYFKSTSKDYQADDHIAAQIQSLFVSVKNDYNVNVWFVHHLTKEQLSKTNALEGYRPTEDNIRGSTRYRDMCTQGILLNRPGEFHDVSKSYRKTPLEEPILHLMVGEVFKNRNGNTGFFRYFANLDYKIFYPF